MAVVNNPLLWTRKTLDEILATGIQLHRESLKASSSTNSLKPKDIVRIFHVGVNVLAADIEKVVEGTITVYRRIASRSEVEPPYFSCFLFWMKNKIK